MGLRIDLDEVSLGTAWSEFQDCEFVQHRRPLRGGVAAQGSFGHRPTRYIRCTFAGVAFRSMGGFSVGRARCEDCFFDRCRFEGSFSFSAEYVRCRFVGPIDGVVFNGTDPNTARRNEIADNDFTGATFSTNVGWRNGFDTRAQRWPDGYVAFPGD